MPEVSVLDVRLHGDRIGTLTLIPGDRTLPVARPVAEAIDAHLQGLTLLSEI